MSTHRIQNRLQLTVAPETIAADSSAEPELARTIIRELLASPKPEPDEFGISPFRELWVAFAPEGNAELELPAEIDSAGFSQTWLNGFSLIRPSDSFIQDFQQSLQQSLRWLFESTEHFPQQDAIILRIVAS